jgi:hypothetical protein
VASDEAGAAGDEPHHRPNFRTNAFALSGMKFTKAQVRSRHA